MHLAVFLSFFGIVSHRFFSAPHQHFIYPLSRACVKRFFIPDVETKQQTKKDLTA